MVHVPLVCLSEWREFPSTPCFAGKKDIGDSSCLDVVEIARVVWHMLPFSLCNKKRLAIRHMNRPLFPTTLSIPSYDIGKYVGLRICLHPLVFYTFWSSKSICWFSYKHFVCTSLPCMLRDETMKMLTAWNVNVIDRIFKNSDPALPKTQTAPTVKISFFSM